MSSSSRRHGGVVGQTKHLFGKGVARYLRSTSTDCRSSRVKETVDPPAALECAIVLAQQRVVSKYLHGDLVQLLLEETGIQSVH